MANNIAPEWPVDNDGLWWCKITQKQPNPTTGEIEDIDVIGRNDVIAFPSATETLSDAETIHADLQLTLTNVAGTNVYYAYPQGDKARLRLLPTYLDQPVWIHFKAGDGDWHEAARTMVRNKRTATG
jgi:hypothetical protein